MSEIRDKLEKLSLFITDAETRVRDGEMVDMSGLDRDVAVICGRCATLPPEQAADVQPAMAELIGNLERLSFALKDYKDGLKN